MRKKNDWKPNVAKRREVAESERLDASSRQRDAKAANNRGLAYHDKNDYDKAIGDFSEAIRLKPEYTDAYLNRGVAYRKRNEYDKAKADFVKADELRSAVQ